MARQDPSIVKFVFSRKVGELRVVACLSRYGDLAVFVETRVGTYVWQGDNIIEALDWAAGEEGLRTVSLALAE